MANKKSMPASGKSAAGKNTFNKSNKNKKKQKKKQLIKDEKNAKRIVEDRRKKQELREKKSREIQKLRQKENEKKQKIIEKNQSKSKRKFKRKKFYKKIKNRFRYLTSKEFLLSLNYKRIFLFIVVPICVIIFGIVSLCNSVFLNVPRNIASIKYNGRVESEAIVQEIVLNKDQQSVIADALKLHGSRKFDFYCNSTVEVDDGFQMHNMWFGNPSSNDCVLILTIYDGTKILYRSLGIEPGKQLDSATLFDEIPFGKNEVKIAVNAYDAKTDKKIGTKYAKIILSVGVENE